MMTGRLTRIVLLTAAAALGLTAAAASSRAAVPAAEESNERVLERTVTGDIVTVTKRYISVEYAKTKTVSEEMMLPFNEDTAFERLTGLTDLFRGDRVKVVYEQTYLPAEEKGGEPKILKTVAKTISLVKRATTTGFKSDQAVTP